MEETLKDSGTREMHYDTDRVTLTAGRERV